MKRPYLHTTLFSFIICTATRYSLSPGEDMRFLSYPGSKSITSLTVIDVSRSLFTQRDAIHSVLEDNPGNFMQ